MIKYPKNLVVAGRKNLTFSVDSVLRQMDDADLQNGAAPLTTFKPWAGISLNFADSSKNTGGTGNIEASHIADVHSRTQAMMYPIMLAEAKSKASKSGSNAGTHQVSATETKVKSAKIVYLPAEMKDLKGMTALEIAERTGYNGAMKAAELLEQAAAKGGNYAKANQDQANALKMAATLVCAKQVNMPDGRSVADLFVEEGIDKAKQTVTALYNTDAQHPAVSAAVNLMNLINADPGCISMLSKTESADEDQGLLFDIYGPVLKTPNIGKIDSDGCTKAYELWIACNPQRIGYPFHAELQTMRGIPLQGRQVGIQGNTIRDRKNFSIDLTSWEWNDMISRSDWEKKLVELYFHPKAYATMLAADEENFRARQNRQG